MKQQRSQWNANKGKQRKRHGKTKSKRKEFQNRRTLANCANKKIKAERKVQSFGNEVVLPGHKWRS